MTAIQSAQEAINAFVEVIAQNYIASDEHSHLDQAGVDELVSSIEMDLKSTLRQRISQLDTVKEVEQTPTLDVAQSAILADRDGNEVDLGVSVSAPEDMQRTLDETINLNEYADLHQTPNSGEAVTRDLSDESAITRGDVNVYASGSPHKADLSYDDCATMDTGVEVRSSQKQPTSADVPDGYEVLGVLGKGGMGVVYKARHAALNRIVAIKMILQGEHASAEQLRRFQIEAEAAAHLSHPNIVSVFEVGSHRSMPYFSLEFVEGQSMSDLMRETTMSDRDAAELLSKVARAIDYSHDKGVLHRDLKPQNILVTPEGVPKVADFGLAKRLDDQDAEKTTAGIILGTPGYMAPEQAQCRDNLGPQVDIYAMGSILYYAMTGRPPFAAPTPFETVRQLITQDPVMPSTLQEGLDRDLETICMKCLEKDVSRRYATAGELADELDRFLRHEPIIARPVTRRERLLKWSKRNPRIAMLTGIAASLLLCLLFGGIISAIVFNQQKKAEMLAKNEANANAKLADDQAELALDTTRMILYEAKKFFEAKPELRPLRKNMIDSVVAGVEKIHAKRYANDVRSTFVASADVQLGQIYLEAGRFEKARDKLLEAQSKLKVLNKDGKLNRADVSQMNITLALGDSYRKLGQLDAAQQQYLKLMKLRKKYFADYADFNPLLVDASMAEVYGRLATIYSERGVPDEALRYGLLSTQARRAWFQANPNSASGAAELSGSLTTLSTLYEKAGDFDKMIQTSTESLELQARVAEVRSDSATLHNTAMKQRIVAKQCLLQGVQSGW